MVENSAGDLRFLSRRRCKSRSERKGRRVEVRAPDLGLQFRSAQSGHSLHPDSRLSLSRDSPAKAACGEDLRVSDCLTIAPTHTRSLYTVDAHTPQKLLYRGEISNILARLMAASALLNVIAIACSGSSLPSFRRPRLLGLC